ncbi:MAG: DinB family protein [Gemmataceae bacterium]|nr:DinB family protein [Gemmataceae bacterium]MCI0738778.1 DinB family protein [Gemmataceae bacterium]
MAANPNTSPTRERGNAEISLLLHLVDTAFNKKSWHGPNLRGAIRRVEAATAAWRPSPQRRNIWEIVVHCAYWKYAVRRRLLGEKRGSFAFKGSNWFARPSPVEPHEWEDDVHVLDEMHKALRAAVADYSPKDLQKIPKGGTFTAREVIAAIAAHDLYHAGQIQILKRLAAEI